LNLGLSGAFDYSNTSGFGPGPQLSSTWSVALAATLNVSDGGLTKDRVDEARQRLEQLKAAEAQQRQAIELDVRQSYLNLQSARPRGSCGRGAGRPMVPSRPPVRSRPRR